MRLLALRLYCRLIGLVLLLLLAPTMVHGAAMRATAGQSADLAARAERAKQAMSTNRFDEAVTLYREILETVPNEPGILMNLGMALSMAGQPKEAIQPLTRALAVRPSLLPAALFLGQCYLDIGQPAEAIAPLEKYLAAQPANLQARLMLASAQLMAGHHRDAAAQFRRVSQAAPAEAKGWYGLVQAYDALSQEALDALQKTPEGGAYAPLLAADAFESEGKLELAFAAYKQSLEQLPRLRSTHDALARLYTKTGHADWAAQQAAKARAIPLACGPTATGTATGTARTGASGTAEAGKPPRATNGGTSAKATAGAAAVTGLTGETAPTAAASPAAASPTTATSPATSRTPPATTRPAGAGASARNAECEFRAGRYLPAISALGTRMDAEAQYWRTRAYAELASAALAKLTAMPPSQELHELRAELYRNQRRHLQSAQELKAALTFAPNDPRLRRELAKSLYFTRDWGTARALFEELLKAQPKDPELEFFYGDVLLQAQQAEAAVPHLQAALDGDPTISPAHASLGRALVQLGRFADAIPHLEAVVDQDKDGSIHYQLARAYQSTGQADRAIPLLEKYQALQRASPPSTPNAPAVITPPEE